MGSLRLAVAAVAAALVCAASPAQAVVAPVQTGTVRAPSSGGSHGFGASVAVAGDTVVVGAPYATVGGVDLAGAAIVYQRTATGGLVELGRLTASDVVEGDYFGLSVAISGRTIVVGAPGEIPQSTFPTSGRQAAYVFVRPAGGWRSMTQTARLTRSATAGAHGVFGSPVAISGRTIAVSTYDGGISGALGEAVVFTRPADGWADATETARLTPADAAAGTDFTGQSIAVSGSTVVLGAPDADNGGSQRGAAYVFERPAGGWRTLTGGTSLPFSEARDSQGFGTSVAILGDVIAVGAPGLELFAPSVPPVVAVYRRSADGWDAVTREALVLRRPASPIKRQFGMSVALGRGTLVVGAPGPYSASGRTAAGRGYVYGPRADDWSSVTAPAVISGADAGPGDFFGVAVATSGPWIAAGASWAQSSSSSARGRAYLYRVASISVLRAPSDPDGTVHADVRVPGAGTLRIRGVRGWRAAGGRLVCSGRVRVDGAGVAHVTCRPNDAMRAALAVGPVQVTLNLTFASAPQAVVREQALITVGSGSPVAG